MTDTNQTTAPEGTAAVASQVSSTLLPASSVIIASSVIASNHTTWTTRDISRKYRLDNSGRLRIPDCQRAYAKQWEHLRRRHDLIDSIFHNFPLGTIILEKTYRHSDDVDAYFDIYDGRHRIETITRFVNNEFKYKGVFYRDLTVADRKVFDERKIPVTEIEFNGDTDRLTRTGTLAEIFIRLNKGVKLSDSDLCWANRDMPLVRETLAMLDTYEVRLREVFGGFDVKNRKSLNNWVGLFLGLSTNDRNNFTTSYIHISDHIQNQPNVEAITSGIETLLRLYDLANTESPVANKELKKYAKIGFVNAFFFADLLAPENAAAEGVVVNRWLDIIRRLRTAEHCEAMTRALKTTSAQNLNADKIRKVLDQIERHYAGEADDHISIGDDSDDEDAV